MDTPDAAPDHPEVERIVAPNPAPMTLEGTNTYLYGQDPCVVIDPGPDHPGHLQRVRDVGDRRGGIGAVLVTHSHADHAEGAVSLAASVTVRVLAPADGEISFGLRALATPGHAADHVCLLTGDGVCFSGDLILGSGSTFVPPDPGALAAYLKSLRDLRSEEVELICPGHGPWVTDPSTKLDQYIEHRQERENRLISALADGERSRSALLDLVWDEVPPNLRPAAAQVMEAHLGKLADEGRLPSGLHD